MAKAVQALQALRTSSGRDLPLAETLLAIALEENPSLDAEACLDQLDGWAGRARGLLSRVGELAAVRQALFEEGGLEGDTETYYDPQNSLLDAVIRRRRGLPIMLAAIYVEVVRRAGGEAHGVGFPGHFLVGHKIAGRVVLVDAFDGGSVISEEALQARLPKQAELEPWMTAPCDGHDLALRVLTNLTHAYLREDDPMSAVTALDRMLAIDPDRLDARRDRGLLYAKLRLPQAALPDIKAYVSQRPTADDTPKLIALLPALERDLGQLD